MAAFKCTEVFNIRVTKEQKEAIERRNREIFEMYKNSASFEEICEKYNLTNSCIRNIINNLRDDVIKHKKTDYKLYDYYDLSILSNNEIEILNRKNSGETFVKIAREMNLTSNTVRMKALSAIEKLQHKDLTTRVYSRKYYHTHLEQERLRSQKKRKGLREVKHCDEAECKEICDLRKQGISVAEIAKLKKRSRQHVYNVLRDYLSENDKEKLIRKYL